MEEATSRPRTRFFLLVAVTLAAALAGYVGFLSHASLRVGAGPGAGLLALAAAAGVGAFFSPCAFPLLLTITTRQVGGEHPAREALRFAAALSLGASGFLLLAGAALAAGAGAFFSEVTFASAGGRLIRIVTGSFLILMALVQLNVLPVSFLPVEEAARPLVRGHADLRRRRPFTGFVLFGFGYLLAGFG